MPREDSRLISALALSGSAALGYELLWTRLLGLALGHEFLGVLAALAGFFGGLALGAAALHERARTAKDPARLFVRLELIAATYALVSPLLLHSLVGWLPALLGPTVADGGATGITLSLAVSTLALLPATVCMGATLPALVEARRRVVRTDSDGRGLGRLYAANTAGAVAGTLLAVHLLLPRLGLVGGAFAIAALGFAGAGVAWTWARRHPAPAPVPAEEIPPIDTSKDPDREVLSERWLLLVLVFCTGLLGVGVEVVGVRVLSQAMSNTVYTFADVLAVFLLGTAAGAWIYQRQADRALAGAPARVTAALLLAQALSVVVAATALRHSPAMIAGLAGPEPGFGAQALAEALTALAVFCAPTLIMGALFSHLVGMLARRGIGRAYALNTLGSALAPFALGLIAIPELGYTDAFFALSWAYLGLMVLFCWFRRFSTAWQLGAMVAVVGATVLGRGSLVLIEIPEDWELIEQRESVMGVISVSERRAEPGTPVEARLRRLQVDQQFRMGGALSIGERRMGHIPLLLHGEPERVLYLGVGTGATAGAALAHPVESIDAVELVPQVLEMLPHFEQVNGGLAQAPRAHLHAADARRWLAASDRRFDVIVADLFHPERDGAGFLYTREHFETVRAHLAEGGVFAQWLPLHQMDPDTLRTVIATFLDVFPEAHSWLALYNVDSPAFGLIGTTGEPPLRVDLARLTATTRDPAFAPVVLQDPRDLLAGYMLDRAALAALTADAPLNTDLRPRVLFDAPKSGRDRLGLANLRILLPLRTPFPPGLVDAGEDTELVPQTAAFARALDHYLAGEMIFVERARPGEPLPEAAIDEYVAAVEAAPEFLPAHGRLKTQLVLLQRAGFEDEARALVERLGGAATRD